MSEDKYFVDADEISSVNSVPLISKIKIGTKNFDITSPKDWSENRPAHRAYIHGRTHYEDLRRYTEEDLKLLETCQHYFNNINETDFWHPTVEWFDPTLGKKYKFSFRYNNEDEANATSFDWELSNSLYTFEHSGTTIELKFDSSSGTFQIQGEKISIENTLTIKPIIFDIKADTETQEATSYNIVKKLDTKFISLDHKTIIQNSRGQLQTDALFEEDFRVSQDFGKYKAKDTIAAEGKTLTQIFKEAFCEDLQPSKVTLPRIVSYSIYDELESETGPLIYEIGTTNKTLNWKLIYNPGKYSYGTKNGYDSNVYMDSLDFTYDSKNENCALSPLDMPELERKPNVGDQHFFGTFNLTVNKVGSGQSKVKVKFRYDPDDYSVTSLGEQAVPEVIFELNEGDLIVAPREIVGAYRWFWGYRNAGDDEITDFSKIDRTAFQSSSLIGFPEEFTTSKAKQWFFAVPKTETGEAFGTVLGLKNKYSDADVSPIINEMNITLTDAAGEEHGYLLFYINNNEADLGTNTYKIIYEDGGVMNG